MSVVLVEKSLPRVSVLEYMHERCAECSVPTSTPVGAPLQQMNCFGSVGALPKLVKCYKSVNGRECSGLQRWNNEVECGRVSGKIKLVLFGALAVVTGEFGQRSVKTEECVMSGRSLKLKNPIAVGDGISVEAVVLMADGYITYVISKDCMKYVLR